MLYVKLQFDHLVSLNDITGISRGLSVTGNKDNEIEYENGRAIYLYDKNGAKLFTFYKNEQRAKEVFYELIAWLKYQKLNESINVFEFPKD